VLSPKKDAGFSLIELVLVVAIMLLVSAFALPGLNAMMQSYRVSNDARGIVAQLSLARMRAAEEFSEWPWNELASASEMAPGAPLFPRPTPRARRQPSQG